MFRSLPQPPARYRFTGARPLIVALAMLIPVVVHAQTIGRLIGTVTDDNERPLQGAVVKVLGASPTREITINKADGGYALTGLRPGDYEIEFRAKGYEAQRKSVRVAADRTSILNARLLLEQPESVVGVPRSVEIPPVRKAEEKRVANIGSSRGDEAPTLPAVEPRGSEPVRSDAPVTEPPAREPATVESTPADRLKGDLPRAGDTLSARTSGGIMVNVIDDEGKPLGGARLFVGDARKSLATLPDGSLGVEHLPPGDYDLTLTAKGCQAEKRTVRVVANHVVTLIVRLAAAR